MTAIIIASFTGFCSRGSEALLRTRINSIRRLTHGVKFYVLTVYTEECKPITGVEYIDTFGGRRERFISVIYLVSSVYRAISWTTNALAFRYFGFCFNKSIEKIASSEMFISSDGDVLGEDYGFLPFLWRTYFLSLGILLKKPVVIYAEGAGPFNSRIGRIISKYLFDRCVKISVRDEISREHLVDLGIDRGRISLVADSAFLLSPSAKDYNYRKKGKKLIGIAVSELAVKYGFRCKKNEEPYNSFVIFMSELIDWMVENLGANVIMISHAIQPKRDDYRTASDITKRIKNRDQVEILDKNFTAADFKKAISYCDLVISSRLHAAIAALSTCVPVIGIAYSHKLASIFNSFDMADLAINIQDLDWRITKKIKETLANSGYIKKRLRLKMVSIRKLAEKPAFDVAQILIKGGSTTGIKAL